MSSHSPSVIENSEVFSRFLFSPIQIDKKGKFKPSSFSHVHTRGCSIQRDSIANNDELLAVINYVLQLGDDRAWKGVIFGDCNEIRNIMDDSATHRLVCTYDTANPDNPAHAELFQSQYIIDEADALELRHNLFVAFGNGNIVSPSKYRSGSVWANLSPQFQARP